MPARAAKSAVAAARHAALKRGSIAAPRGDRLDRLMGSTAVIGTWCSGNGRRSRDRCPPQRHNEHRRYWTAAQLWRIMAFAFAGSGT